MPRNQNELNYPHLLRNDLDYGQNNALQLVVTTRSSIARTILLRGFNKSGFFEHRIITNGAAGVPTGQEFTFNMSEIPTGLSLEGDGGNDFQPGAVYARVELRMAGETTLILCSGYVTVEGSLTYPQSLSAGHPRDSRGLFRTINGTDPAANNEISETIPDGSIWRLHAVSFALVADANAANRTVSLRITNGALTSIQIPAPAVQTANQTVRYTFGIGLANFADTTNLIFTAPLPEHLLIGDNLAWHTVTTNRQAGDNFGQPVFRVEEWFDATRLFP